MHMSLELSAKSGLIKTYIAVHVMKRVKHVKPVHIDDCRIDREL